MSIEREMFFIFLDLSIYYAIIIIDYLIWRIKSMADNIVREPIQKRSIEKKEKIIKYGFDLICEKGYHCTNTAEIAKAAGVSTGIVYSYFSDKHDILLEGLKRYSNNIFYPSIDFIKDININEKNLDEIIRKIISQFVKNHKLSQSAHEEITAMAHSDIDVANIFHENEIEMTNVITQLLNENGFNHSDLVERVHIIIGLIDNICHETVYHKHKNINYDVMTNIVVNEIKHILTK
jgi:AcrR family transcriptional regulator